MFNDAASRAPSSLASASAYGSDDDDYNNSNYKDKRSRNNAAVRKSREKTKGRAANAQENLILLKKENSQLEQRRKELTEELEMLKESFIRQMKDYVDKARAFDALNDVNNNNNNNNSDGTGVNGNNNDDGQIVVSAPPAFFYAL